MIDTVITVVRGILSSWYASTFSHIEGMQLIGKLFKLTKREYNKKTSAEHEESFRAIDNIQRFYAGQLFQAFLDIPFIFVFLGGIYILTGKLVYFHICVLIFYLLFNFVYQFVFKHFRNKEIDSNSDRIGLITNLLNRIHPIKAQAFEEMLLRKLDVYQSRFSLADLQMKNKSNLPAALGEFLSQLMIYGTIVLGGIIVIKGGLSIGVISAATMLARRTVSPLLSLSRFSLSLSEVNIGFEKIDFQSEVPEVNASDFKLPNNIEGFLELRNLSLNRESIGCGKLDNINLEVHKGTVIGIFCEDQPAADLLMDVLIGVEKPDSGKVLLDSFVLSGMDGLLNIPEIAILPRKGELFAGTILENITLFNPKPNKSEPKRFKIIKTPIF
ncbi:Leukotoxin export ATP-binding protein LtxB [subsurface metagenome]